MALAERETKYKRHLHRQRTLGGGMRDVKTRLLPGMYKTPLKAHIIGSCFNCVRYDPFALCAHGCIYCYSLDKTASLYQNLYDNYDPDLIRPADTDQARDAFYEAFNRNTRGSTLINMLRKKVPLHMSDLTDPFQPREKELYEKHGTSPTLEALKLLNEYEYPLIVSTKSSLPSEEPWRSALLDLVPHGLIMQASITTLDEVKRKKLEPGASPAIQRLMMLRDLKEGGCKRTVVRISPILPWITSGEDTWKPIVDASVMSGVDVFMIAMLFISGNKDITRGIQKAFGIDMLKRYKDMPNIYVYGAQYNLQFNICKDIMFPIRDYIHSRDYPVNFDMPPGMYPLSDMYHCCGGDGMFKSSQLNNLGQRGVARFISDYKKPVRWDFFRSLVENDIVSKEHDTALKNMWKNTLWQMVGVQYLGTDSDGMPIFQGIDPETDPKLTEGLKQG